MSKVVDEQEYEGEYEEVEEEEEDTTIANSDVITKYKKIAIWANDVLKLVIADCKVGAKVLDVCTHGDALIGEKVATMFKGVEKGIAFPTSVSLNSCVAFNSPAADDEKAAAQVMAANDVVHIDLGIQVDGYCAVVAHTLVLTSDDQLPDSPVGNVINAAYIAMMTAVRKVRPGTNTSEVSEVLEKVAEHFGVNIVEGCLSHQMKRYIIDGSQSIICKQNPEYRVVDHVIEAAQVWSLDVAFTTGKGKLKERDTKCSIYKVALDGNYKPKMDSAKEVMAEIDNRFQTFPFAVRNSNCKRIRLGLSEIVKHGVVVPYPPLFEKDGETVGHFKMTVLVTPKKIERSTGLPCQKPTKEAAAFTDEMLLTTAKLPFAIKAKKKEDAEAKE